MDVDQMVALFTTEIHTVNVIPAQPHCNEWFLHNFTYE